MNRLRASSEFETEIQRKRVVLILVAVVVGKTRAVEGLGR